MPIFHRHSGSGVQGYITGKHAEKAAWSEAMGKQSEVAAGEGAEERGEYTMRNQSDEGAKEKGEAGDAMLLSGIYDRNFISSAQVRHTHLHTLNSKSQNQPKPRTPNPKSFDLDRTLTLRPKS